MNLTAVTADLSRDSIEINLIDHTQATSLLSFTTPYEDTVELVLSHDHLRQLAQKLVATLADDHLPAAP